MVDKIDARSGVPLYRQLYQILHAKIKQKRWLPGELMPAESALTKKYGVSRITIRQVFDLLVKDGLIYRERGRGTYIAEPKLEHGLERISSFTEEMERRGKKPGSQVLASRMVAVSEDTARNLEMKTGDDVVMILRLRTADDDPVCVEESLLNPAYCKGILKKNLKGKSLQKILRQTYGQHWSHARQKIQAIRADAVRAKQLGIKKGDPVLYFERISCNQENRPVEFLLAWYRADRYALYNELKG